MILWRWDDPIGETAGAFKCWIDSFMFLWGKEPRQGKLIPIKHQAVHR